MISINTAQWYALLSAYIWPFVRIMGVMATDPFFGNRTITARVKIGMGIALTVLMQPLLPALPAVDPAGATGLLVLVYQFLIGVAMGFSLRLVFTAVEMAGHFAGLQMGLGFAMFFDPQHGTQVPVVAQLTSLLTLLLLLATDAHLLIIHTLADSFKLLPVQHLPLAAAGWKILVEWGGQIFLLGLRLSMPVVATLLIVNLAIGVMTRASPQFNIFAVGFPITVGIGMLVLYVSLPQFLPILLDAFNSNAEMLRKMLATLAAPS